MHLPLAVDWAGLWMRLLYARHILLLKRGFVKLMICLDDSELVMAQSFEEGFRFSITTAVLRLCV